MISINNVMRLDRMSGQYGNRQLCQPLISEPPYFAPALAKKQYKALSSQQKSVTIPNSGCDSTDNPPSDSLLQFYGLKKG